jgi:DHA1 family tetracycline resistance protein-like MFS transporter
MMAIFLIAVMDFLGFGIIIPLLPRLIPNYKDEAFKVTLIFSVYSICQFVGAPILGAMSDRFGRRPVLVISQIGSALGYLLLGVAPFVEQWWNGSSPHSGLLASVFGSAAILKLTLVYASRVIDGFTGGNISTAQAYVSDVTTPETRAKGMGMLGAAFGIGFSAGPALGGLLSYYGGMWVSPAFGTALPAFVAAFLALAAAHLSFHRLVEARTHKPTDAEVWFHPSKFAVAFKNRVVGQLLLISFCIMAAFVMMESVLVLFLDTHFGFTELGTGLFFAWLGLCIIIVQGRLVGPLSRRFGEWPLAIAGPILVALGMAAFTGTAYNSAIALLLVAGAVNAGGRSLQQPAASSLLSKYSPPRDQGVVFGIYHGLGSLARVVGPLVAGNVYGLMRNTGPYIIAGVVAIIVTGWTLLLSRTAGPAHGVDARAGAAEPA